MPTTLTIIGGAVGESPTVTGRTKTLTTAHRPTEVFAVNESDVGLLTKDVADSRELLQDTNCPMPAAIPE